MPSDASSVPNGEGELDAVVIGAGAAGLAAAADLSRAKLKVLVLEARDRLGGRVWTLRHPRTGVPVELGAEFVHDPAPESRGILDRAGLRTIGFAGEHWRARDGHLDPAGGFWERIRRVLSKLDPGRHPDRSFLDFLRETNGDLSREDRELALGFVENFHAADAALASERALASSGGGTDEAGRGGRVSAGYDRLVEALARDVTGAIRLGTTVHRVEWRRGGVRVHLRDATGGGRDLGPADARAAIVTVPLGVLKRRPNQAGALVFEPDLPLMREVSSRLFPGSAVRIALLFRERVWTSPGGGGGVASGNARERAASAGPVLESLGFLHTPDGPFSVWWTGGPREAPLLVAWVGGPRAAALAGAGPRELEDRALRQLARALGLPVGKLEGSLEGSFTHDWEGDPLADGAYSYAGVGGAEAGEALARPIAGTLFLAGEAIAPPGMGGTVESAIASGRRAARDLLSGL